MKLTKKLASQPKRSTTKSAGTPKATSKTPKGSKSLQECQDHAKSVYNKEFDSITKSDAAEPESSGFSGFLDKLTSAFGGEKPAKPTYKQAGQAKFKSTMAFRNCPVDWEKS